MYDVVEFGVVTLSTEFNAIEIALFFGLLEEKKNMRRGLIFYLKHNKCYIFFLNPNTGLLLGNRFRSKINLLLLISLSKLIFGLGLA